jgi:hypothetical protein
LDLRLFGIALRARWLWLRRAYMSRPWVTLPGEEDRQTTAFFKASVEFRIGDGDAFLFWKDPWLQGQRLADIAPNLLAGASVEAENSATSAERSCLGLRHLRCTDGPRSGLVCSSPPAFVGCASVSESAGPIAVAVDSQ